MPAQASLLLIAKQILSKATANLALMGAVVVMATARGLQMVGLLPRSGALFALGLSSKLMRVAASHWRRQRGHRATRAR